MAKVKAEGGTQKQALNEAGWLGGEVRAAGQLRQGSAPSMAAMVTGAALVEVFRPRRSKLLPRHFVLAVTEDRVVAFKASGGSGEDAGSPYIISIRDGEEGSWPRDAVRITELEEGDQSKGGMLEIQTDSGVERIPVARPNLNGDPDTDELLRLLSG
jgi:hypothetical protein